MLRLNTIRKKKKPLLTPLNINKHIKQAFSPSLSGQNQCVALVIYIIALLLKIKERVTQSKTFTQKNGKPSLFSYQSMGSASKAKNKSNKIAKEGK